MKRLSTLLFITCFVSTLYLSAQITFPQDGVYDHREGLYAFTNATIYKTYNQKIENATLLIKDGKIVNVGSGISIPNNAVTIDAKGTTIYPSFIDVYSKYGLPEVKRERRSGGFWAAQQRLSKKEGAYSWNQALKPEVRAHKIFTADEKSAGAYRKQGFGAVATHQMDGISRGTSTLVALGDEREHNLILKDQVAHHLSFKKGTSTQNYPGSLMGGISLIRQTYMDGEWYKKQSKEFNISLNAWNEVQDLPQFFEVRDIQEILRAQKVAKEFNKKYIFHGIGDEYKRLDKVKAMRTTIVTPLNFPAPFDVEDPYDALQVSLGDMKHWEMAPTNPGALVKAGINVVLTANGLKDKSSFHSNLRKAIKNGLSKEVALKALTHTPAKLLNAYDILGTLESGKYANFIIASGDIFDEKTKILHNWINGKPYIFKDLQSEALAGKYDLQVGSKKYQLMVAGEAGKEDMKIQIDDSTSIKVKHTFDDGLISLSFKPTPKAKKVISLSGVAEGKRWVGNGTETDGKWTSWSAKHVGDSDKTDKKKTGGKDKKKEKPTDKIGDVIYPFLAYGNKELPKPKTYLIRNATVWTNEADGILENADVLISEGKVVNVGKSLNTKDAITIDATGKHVTCGVIDEHSHIAISRGVNECTQTVTAEVRIGDVVDSEDIDIYRQLAGGVTTSQLLHGSCNPIGGQSAIIKLRWGYTGEDMKFENTDGFIKFALGENVKRSRSSNNDRFPNTRMGVEQVYVDAFTRAKEYRKKKQAGGADFREDLEMEALLEILDKKRFISCHSYVQSEINMLMHVADDMGFKVNTFTYILEGYKVADKMREHGAGGSSFSDWWAYKYEVIDAIPYNGALMHEQGVLTAFNSDDAEMARRLNQEAAKAVMYGDVPEEEAWKFVTLNPAKLLHIDDRVGSIKTGKDADIVIWSDHPLSIYAKAEKTFVDGIKFFDREEDKQKQIEVQTERARLIQKMLAAKSGGAKMRKPGGKWTRHYHCDDAEDEMVD